MTRDHTCFFWVCLLSSIGRLVSAQVPEVPFAFPVWHVPAFPDRTFDIRTYGAKPEVAATEAIRQAIEACHRAGGGKVLVPQGTWLIGPIHLKSHVNLHLEEGAELRFSQRFADYLPVVLIQRGGYFCYNYSPMIYAKGCENIAVTGKGTLNGQGQVWWPWKKHQPGMEDLFRMGKSGVPIERAIQYSEQAAELAHAPVFRNIHIENIRCQSALTALSLRGLPGGEYLTDLTCKNLAIKANKGVICSQASSITFEQSTIEPLAGPVFRLEDCQGVQFKEKIQKPANFLSLGGTSTSGIVVHYQGPKPAVALDQDLDKSSVIKLIPQD